MIIICQQHSRHGCRAPTPPTPFFCCRYDMFFRHDSFAIICHLRFACRLRQRYTIRLRHYADIVAALPPLMMSLPRYMPIFFFISLAAITS